MEITQGQYNTANQSIRNILVQIDLMNFQYQILGSLSGNILDGDIKIDANSDLRRTCNLSLVVTDSSFDVAVGGKIYLDKMVKIQVGVEDIRTGTTTWTNLGMYIINQPTYQYDASTRTLSFDGVDLIALLNGTRKGYIGNNTEALFTKGDNVRETIIKILTQNNITNYVVSECLTSEGSIQPVSYDYEFKKADTWYDILASLRDIQPNYQIYFDVDGVFHYEQIPMQNNAPIMIDMNTWANNVISEQTDVDFEAVKNVIEVYGKTHSTSHVSDVDETTVSGNTITPTYSGLNELEDYEEIAFTLPSRVSANSIFVSITDVGTYKVVDDFGNNVTNLDANTYYCLQYLMDSGTWLLCGGKEAYGIWKDDNPNSPFYWQGELGELRLPLYGGDYDDIQTDYLAAQRAAYEGYYRCRLQDSVSLTTAPIYWADVNIRVEYKPLDGTTTNQYTVQSVNIPLTETNTQTWKLARYYGEYPVI